MYVFEKYIMAILWMIGRDSELQHVKVQVVFLFFTLQKFPREQLNINLIQMKNKTNQKKPTTLLH